MTPAKETTGIRKSRFSEGQTVGLLEQTEAGYTVAELSRQIGIMNTTFWKCRSKFAGIDVSAARRLRPFEGEQVPQGFVSDRAFDIQVLRGARPIMTKSALRRQTVLHIFVAYCYSERRVCLLVELNRMTLLRVPPPDCDDDWCK